MRRKVLIIGRREIEKTEGGFDESKGLFDKVKH